MIELQEKYVDFRDIIQRQLLRDLYACDHKEKSSFGTSTEVRDSDICFNISQFNDRSIEEKNDFRAHYFELTFINDLIRSIERHRNRPK
jgi:hypothetical protein